MRIPEEKVEEIRSANDIVEVVSDYVQLKRRGQNFIGLCPFHSEKTPSFNVNPHVGIFKCFGCGKGGDVFNFVSEIENVSNGEAIRTLADRAQIVLPLQTDSFQEDNNEPILAALRFAARFYWEQLTTTEAGREQGLGYFRKRGFINETIKKFGLGYAPDAWDGLLKAAEVAQIKPQYLQQAGLIIPRQDGSGFYDRFRGRVVFPIISHVGRVVGFGGRILTEAKDQPKYINSPETPVYQKSQILFGLHQSRHEIRALSEALLVEGYTDVISLNQGQIRNAVASSGTALTPQQVQLLSRYCKKVVVIYDADAAGINATLRGVRIIFAGGLTAEIVELEKGADPDSFIRNFGGEALRNYIRTHRQDYLTFRIAKAKADGAWNFPDQRAEVVHEIVETVAHIPDPIMRDLYLQNAASLLNMPEAGLRQALERTNVRKMPVYPRQKPEKTTVYEDVAPPDDGQVSPPLQETEATPRSTKVWAHPAEALLVRLMLDEGAPMVEFILGHMALEEFTDGFARETVLQIANQYTEGQIAPDRFISGQFGTDIRDWVSGLMLDKEVISVRWGERVKGARARMNQHPYEVAEDAMTRLKLHALDRVLEDVQGQIRMTAPSGEDLNTLLGQQMHLIALRKQIEERSFLNTES